MIYNYSVHVSWSTSFSIYHCTRCGTFSDCLEYATECSFLYGATWRIYLIFDMVYYYRRRLVARSSWF